MEKNLLKKINLVVHWKKKFWVKNMPQLLLLELKEVLLNWKLKSKRKNLIKRKMKS